MARPVARQSRAAAAGLPQWTKPRLTQLVDQAPDGPDWLHEIKFDGYRMHARLDRGAVRLLTRTGLDWTHKYPAIATAVSSIGARHAYLDGELCGVRPDGITSFSMIQAASDSGSAAALVFSLFDLLYLDGEDLCPRPLIERKARLAALLSNASSPLHYCDHQTGHGRAFHEKACAMALEGIVSKLADAPYAPGNRGLWVKIYWHSGFGDNDEELPDDIDDEKYIAIPDKKELDLGKPLVLDFAREFLPDDYDEVRHIFSRRGAYRRFKDLLVRRGAIDQWEDFSNKAEEAALREWCAENGIELTGP
jgi:hypothetical protein